MLHCSPHSLPAAIALLPGLVTDTLAAKPAPPPPPVPTGTIFFTSPTGFYFVPVRYQRRRFQIAAVMLACLIGSGNALHAAIITYDASTGLLPDATGWTLDSAGTDGAISISGGVLNMTAATGSRRDWGVNPVPATFGEQGAFMEATVRIVAETHSRSDRGISIAGIGHADGATGSAADVYAWTDRIFVMNSYDQFAGGFLMDTTDGFNTYRAELLFDKLWIFVDDALVLDLTVPILPAALNAVGGEFGVGGNFSGGTAEWTEVRLGSLADIGGPTVPEPASWILGLLGVVATPLLRRGIRQLV
jgi:hypothetical protein